MFKNRIGFLILFSLLVMASCKKDVNPSITQDPVISILAPTINNTISLSAVDSIFLQIAVIDNDGLHLVVTNIYNQDGVNVFKQADHVDDLEYHLQKYFSPANITTESTYKLRIDAEDHSGHTANKIIWFTVKP
jgi:hypothetical protein